MKLGTFLALGLSLVLVGCGQTATPAAKAPASTPAKVAPKPAPTPAATNREVTLLIPAQNGWGSVAPEDLKPELVEKGLHSLFLNPDLHASIAVFAYATVVDADTQAQMLHDQFSGKTDQAAMPVTIVDDDRASFLVHAVDFDGKVLVLSYPMSGVVFQFIGRWPIEANDAAIKDFDTITAGAKLQ
jgi:hypothetical protein